MGSAYNKLGDYSKAAEACREAIRLKPDDAKAWYHLGTAQAKMGRREDAMTSYNRLKQLDRSLADEYFDKVVFIGDPLPRSTVEQPAKGK
jgi:Flp pilus assembly protein TadD